MVKHKQNRKYYKPGSLRVMQSELNLQKKDPVRTYILKYQSSNGSRKVLEGKANELRQIGMGKKNTSNALDVSEEEILWGKGEPGDGSPLSLVMVLLCLW